MLSNIQKKHKDRYRIQFCNENFYIENQSYFKIWKSRFSHLSEIEKLQAWFVALCCLRRPQDWFGGKRQFSIRQDYNFKHQMSLKELFENTPVLIPKKINSEQNIFEFINNYKVKALPEACFRSLCFMADNRYPLFIVKGEVSPFELLNIQIKGERIVALNEDYETWPYSLYSQRDFLGFTLHDLIHADHFFSEPKHRNGQIGFYKFIQNFRQDSMLTQLIENSEFRSGFEYIISDMNSHPLHLFQTLHSLLFKNLKNDKLAQEIWLSWADKTSCSPEELAAINRVNSPDFKTDDAEKIEHLCERLSQT